MSDEKTPSLWDRVRARALAVGDAVFSHMPLPLQAVWRFGRDVDKRFSHTRSPIAAAAIAFYGVICLMPLSILLVIGIQYASRWDEDVIADVQARVTEIAPGDAGQLVVDQIGELLNAGNLSIPIGLGVLSLVWGAMRLFEVLGASLNAIWLDAPNRGFFARKFVGLVTLLGAGVSLTGYMVATSMAAGFRQWLSDIELLGDQQIVPDGWIPLIIGAPFAFAAFWLLYKAVPTKYVRSRAAAAGALAATLGLLVSHPVFTHFIARSSRSHALYGELASVVIFALWMYYVAQLVFLGAHVAAQVEGAPMPAKKGAEISPE